jgi:ketosteroid isomerase-like protein
MKRPGGFVLCVLAVIGCAETAEEAAVDPSELILQRFQSGIDGFIAEGDPERAADAYLEIHAPDAVLLLPGAPPVEGHSAIRPFIVDFAQSYEFRFPDWVSEEVIVSGDVAVHRFSGTAIMIPRAGGDTIREDRKYMDIWRQSPSGEWRISRHMFNVNR